MSFRNNIPGPSPFAHQPLRWAAPPQRELPDSSQTPGLLKVITQITFVINYNNGAINTAFPVGNRVASQSFTSPIGVVAVSLSSSMINATTDGIVAVWVSRDTGAQQNISTSTDIMVDHILNQGLSHSMRSGIAFSDDVAPKYGSGENMAIYISSAGTGFANSRVVATATIRFYPLL